MTDPAAVLGTADQRRAQMLRAALEVISARGYADTRIADVAVRTGISPALVIYYFKTKDQLLTEAIKYSEDSWYSEGLRRIAKLSTAGEQLEELVAMSCLPEADPEPHDSWLLWLDFWAVAAHPDRNPEVAGLRQKADERFRDVIRSLVLAGQQAGEFRAVDAEGFAITLCALLDGLAIQIALEDPVVDSIRAYEISMRYIADQLGLSWTPGRGRSGQGRKAAEKGR